MGILYIPKTFTKKLKYSSLSKKLFLIIIIFRTTLKPQNIAFQVAKTLLTIIHENNFFHFYFK